MEKPQVKLVGENGNVFNIIGLVSQALKTAGLRDKANEFKQRAFKAKSYDEVLAMTMEYCEVN